MLSGLRSRYLIAMGLLGCGGPSSPGPIAPPSGPATSGSAAASSAPAGSTGAKIERGTRWGRPLPAEPKDTTNGRCERVVQCTPEDSVPPEQAYPEPFARCLPEHEGNAFSVKETKRARVDDAKACCYVGQTCHTIRVPPVIGRPLRVDDRAIVSRVEERDDWTDGLASGAQRHFWARFAAFEHASVASFAKLSLDLLAHGAPSDLVELAHRAALDEIHHARLVFALAGRPAVGPGPLPLPRARETSLDALAAESFADGCVGETTAAVLAAEAARAHPDPAVRAALARIAEDEARHAELAWRILAWIARSDPAAFASGVARARSSCDACAHEHDELATCGVLDEETVRAIRARVMTEVVDPCLQALERS